MSIGYLIIIIGTREIKNVFFAVVLVSCGERSFYMAINANEISPHSDRHHMSYMSMDAFIVRCHKAISRHSFRLLLLLSIHIQYDLTSDTSVYMLINVTNTKYGYATCQNPAKNQVDRYPLHNFLWPSNCIALLWPCNSP